MAATSIKKSSLTAVALTAATTVSLSAVGFWYLMATHADSTHVIAYGVTSLFSIALIVGLNLRMRGRWLDALQHDAHALTQLAREDVRQPLAETPIHTAELKSLSATVREERRKLLDLGLTDPLCNIGNRRALDRWLKNFYENPSTRAPLALLLIDIDRFKEINDNHGHQVGDRVLVEFAHKLKQLIRSCDQIARLGGDEFCVVFPNTRLSLAVSLARRLRAQIAPNLEIGERFYLGVGWTGGVSVSDPFDRHYDQVLWRADEALIQAKMAGRNRTQFIPPNTPRTLGFSPEPGARLH